MPILFLWMPPQAICTCGPTPPASAREPVWAYRPTDKDGKTRPNSPSIGAYKGLRTGTAHVLWNNANGTASIWNDSAATGAFTQNTYGPFAGWTAKSIADGPDGKTRVLWNNTSGSMSLWSLDNATGIYGHFEYGPYSGWSAQALSAGP